MKKYDIRNMKLSRLFDFVDYQLENYPQAQAIADLFDGTYRSYSIHEVEIISNQIANGLLGKGYKPGDKIGIVVYRNRAEFTLLDLGLQKARMISVPLYPTISSSEYEYILSESECACVFFGSGDLSDKLNSARANVSTIRELYALDHTPDYASWEDIWKNQSQERPDLNVDTSDLATIIYTSGTTGHPKGVMLSHQNIVENVKSAAAVIPLTAGGQAMSFLPLCHVFERAVSYAYIYLGGKITYTGLDNLGGDDGDLKKIRPHFMSCVPRLLEKIYEKIYQKGLNLTGVKKKLFFWALELTEDYEYDKKYSGTEWLKRAIADKLIFSKWREALGGNIIGIVTGSAPCPMRIAQVFSAAGIPIREGYGLTESSPAITLNGFNTGQAKLGTVGPVIKNVEIKIDQEGDYREGEGEILAAGPNIMQGYYKKPEETAVTLQNIDGKIWLRTGDIGTIVTDKSGTEFLKITDRKKELLKTSAGKYVAPAPIENDLKEDIFIEQAILIGDKHKYVSAIVVPSEETLKNYCRKKSIGWTGFREILKLEEIRNVYEEIIQKVNKKLARHEQIKKFTLVPDVWVPINPDGSAGELTPTLKLKRRVILEKYQNAIEDMYREA